MWHFMISELKRNDALLPCSYNGQLGSIGTPKKCLANTTIPCGGKMKQSTKRVAILDLSDGEYKIIFRNLEHFKSVLRELAVKNYQFFQLDDDGRAHPITEMTDQLF